MILPNAVIAGVNKAGTTALFNALAGHRDVLPSRVKETHFFDPLKYGDDLPELSQYGRFFPAGRESPVVLEATPGYFYGGARLAEVLHRTLPGARIVVMLREPGARAHSWWRFCRSRLLLDDGLPFAEYLDRCARLGTAPERSRDLVAWRGLSGGLYSEYLPAWQDVFGDRLLVCFQDDFQQDAEAFLADVCAHLGIAAGARPAPRDNVTTDVASRTLQRVALRGNVIGERLWRRFPGAKEVLRRAYYGINAAAVQERFSAADRRWLDDYYRDELTRLAPLLSAVPGHPVWLRRAADDRP